MAFCVQRQTFCHELVITHCQFACKVLPVARKYADEACASVYICTCSHVSVCVCVCVSCLMLLYPLCPLVWYTLDTPDVQYIYPVYPMMHSGSFTIVCRACTRTPI